jgi:hypothetical protein
VSRPLSVSFGGRGDVAVDEVRLFPALEDAIRAGALLNCDREPARGGYARVASLLSRDDILALGTGATLHDALHAAEHDLLSNGLLAAEFRGDRCPTCAMNQLDPAGSSEETSALDAQVLTGHRFEVEWAGEQFRLVTEWRREARVPREVMQELIAAGAPTRWRHGDYIWDVVPARSRKTGEWKVASYQSVSRPLGVKDIYPVEKRRVEALGTSLIGVLAAAEDLVAAARHDDEEWHRRTIRCT